MYSFLFNTNSSFYTQRTLSYTLSKCSPVYSLNRCIVTIDGHRIQTGIFNFKKRLMVKIQK